MEDLAAVALPALLPGEPLDPVSQQFPVVELDELLLVRATVLDAQPAADEVRDIAHRRSPAHRLPVHDSAGVVIEQQVVEPVVAVDEAQRRALVRDPAVCAHDEPLAQLDVIGRQALAVAFKESR